MSFLSTIDTIHDECKRQYSTEEISENFCSYIDIEPADKISTNKFVIKKQEKSKILIVSGKQRVYLSDYQILSTILKMDKDYINWFICAFVNLYNNIFEKFKFKIADKEFEGIGISYYPQPKEILLFSDTIIDINEFIFVLNFIFSKDYQWEQDKAKKDFSKRTIIKYITLLDYYANKTERSRDFLEKIGYPIRNEKLYDVSKTKNMFSKINQFDISKYM